MAIMEFSNLKALVERALTDGKLTPQEIAEIEAAIMADGQVTDAEKALLDEIRLKVLRGEFRVGFKKQRSVGI